MVRYYKHIKKKWHFLAYFNSLISHVDILENSRDYSKMSCQFQRLFYILSF
jgi:hypothetical protein